MKKIFYIATSIVLAVGLVGCQKSAISFQKDRVICVESEANVVLHQTATPVEGVPGLEVVETFFVNKGKPVTVKAYELCRTEVTPKENVVWSLQPSSSSARLDWVLPVEEGFAKEITPLQR